MHFLLMTLKVVYVLTTPMLKLVEDATVEAIRIKAKWKNDDYIWRGNILNGMPDSLFDVYTNVESAKELDCHSGNKNNSNTGSRKGSKDQYQYQVAWWIESGATTYVCKDRCWFKTYEPMEDRFVLHMGIIHETIASYKPQQNGMAERKNRALKEMVNSMLSYSVRLLEPKRKTFGEKGIDCLFFGYAKHSKAYRPLCCKWIFKRKMKVDGTIDKFKARLVIQGFRQKEWINYFDTYAPIACITTIRLLFSLAAIHNLVIHQMDVKTAFLNGDLDEEVYMKQPKGFVMPGNEHKVCKLVKSLYGLKQAPKQWHQKFDEVVLSSDFNLNQSDKCVYSKFDNSDKGVIICLYVDDMLIFDTDQNQVDKTKKFLSSRFSMKDMGEADVILSIKIKRKNKRIVITQSQCIEKILKEFNHEDCSPVSTPMDPVEKLRPNTCKPVDQLEYSRAVGCLMYAMTNTRPDIAYAIVLEGYSDASWINYVEDSSSTSGWVFLLRGVPFHWLLRSKHALPDLLWNLSL
nr:zinc finger, CCHC-type [Tanacetum cinerariifolium]